MSCRCDKLSHPTICFTCAGVWGCLCHQGHPRPERLLRAVQGPRPRHQGRLLAFPVWTRPWRHQRLQGRVPGEGQHAGEDEERVVVYVEGRLDTFSPRWGLIRECPLLAGLACPSFCVPLRLFRRKYIWFVPTVPTCFPHSLGTGECHHIWVGFLWAVNGLDLWPFLGGGLGRCFGPAGTVTGASDHRAGICLLHPAGISLLQPVGISLLHPAGIKLLHPTGISLLNLPRIMSVTPRWDQFVTPRWDQFVTPCWNQFVTPHWDQFVTPRWDHYVTPCWNQFVTPRWDQFVTPCWDQFVTPRWDQFVTWQASNMFHNSIPYNPSSHATAHGGYRPLPLRPKIIFLQYFCNTSFPWQYKALRVDGASHWTKCELMPDRLGHRGMWYT